MSHLFPVTSALRPALTSHHSLRTAWRPSNKEDRNFFTLQSGLSSGDDFQPEGAADWGNKVLSEADFSSPLHQ